MYDISLLIRKIKLVYYLHVCCLFSDKISQFKTYRQDNGNLPYDFHSIMHYSNKFFSKNGQDTLRARIDPTMRLGQSEGFSALDVVRINMLYRCPELRENCKYAVS